MTNEADGTGDGETPLTDMVDGVRLHRAAMLRNKSIVDATNLKVATTVDRYLFHQPNNTLTSRICQPVTQHAQRAAHTRYSPHILRSHNTSCLSLASCGYWVHVLLHESHVCSTTKGHR